MLAVQSVPVAPRQLHERVGEPVEGKPASFQNLAPARRSSECGAKSIFWRFLSNSPLCHGRQVRSGDKHQTAQSAACLGDENLKQTSGSGRQSQVPMQLNFELMTLHSPTELGLPCFLWLLRPVIRNPTQKPAGAQNQKGKIRLHRSGCMLPGADVWHRQSLYGACQRYSR